MSYKCTVSPHPDRLSDLQALRWVLWAAAIGALCELACPMHAAPGKTLVEAVRHCDIRGVAIVAGLVAERGRDLTGLSQGIVFIQTNLDDDEHGSVVTVAEPVGSARDLWMISPQGAL